jgi:N-acetylmuramoyl-L-alanine amidase
LEALDEEMYYDSLELLAICVQAEAGNQSLLGRRMVVDVILNRVDDPDFPDTIEGVITQKNAFASYWDGGMDRVYEPDELTFQAVQMEISSRSYPGLLYFRTSRYSSYGTPWRKVGAHYFRTK